MMPTDHRKVGMRMIAPQASVKTAMIAAVIAPKVRQAMDYDMLLAPMANTAYTARDLSGRRTGMKELDAIIPDAVRSRGGPRGGRGKRWPAGGGGARG